MALRTVVLPNQPVAAQQVQVVVEGLALTILDQTGTDGALKIKGELHNQTAADLPGLELTVEIAGASVPAKVKVGDLAADERLTHLWVVEGVEQLTGLAMSWRSGQAHEASPCGWHAAHGRS